MATMWIEIVPEEEGGEVETIHKHGEPMHLLADLRRLLRMHGTELFSHVSLCLHGDHCEPVPEGEP